MRRSRFAGFTIVELLITIVVISILAAVSTAAFNGVKERATFSAAKQKFNTALKAIQLYHTQNGRYPDSENCANGYYHVWCGFNQGVDDGFVPGIVPTYASSLQNLDPSLPDRVNGGSGGDTMLYMSRAANGSSAGTAEFNLIRFRNVDGQGLSQREIIDNPMLMTTDGYQASGQNYGWGYRSNPSLPWF